MNVEAANEKELLLQKRSLTFLYGKNVPPLPLEEERKVFPHRHTNIISRALFYYLNPMLRVGYKRTLQPQDMYVLDERDSVDAMYDKFRNYLDVELDKARAKHIQKKREARAELGNTSTVDEDTDLEDFELPYIVIVKGLFHLFGWQYMWGSLLKVFTDLFYTLMPLVQKRLVNFVEESAYGFHPTLGKGVGYSIGVGLMVYFAGLCVNHFVYNSITVGAKCKAVLTKLLLEKSFRLDARGKHKFPVGKINSIMGTDLTRVDLAIGFFPIIFEFPFSIILCIILLLVNIGVSALAGISLFVVILLFTSYVVRVLYKMRVRANVYTDQRVNLVKELLKNFKMVKMYGWENSYFKQFVDTRQKEMTIVLRMQHIRNFLDALSFWLPIITSMVSFLVLYHLRNNRTVGDIFSSLTLFQELTGQFAMVTPSLSMATDMVVGFKRVAQLISCPDAPALEEFHDLLDDEKLALKLAHASFKWHTFEESATTEVVIVPESKTSSSKDASRTEFPGLHDLTLSISRGEFIVVTGAIGSGKSSLLSAISGFMPKTGGSVAKNGSLLLCGYPWVQNATVRENILFGQPFDQTKYDEIVRVCSLDTDFELFSAGDMTEVGERGITLSGGQKARINLARAVYSDRDIILLDDVLSAVDAKVGKHIMEQCILGYLKGKTRILATHQLSLINAADKVIFLNGNGSIDYGTLHEVRSRNSAFIRLMEFSHDPEEEQRPDEADEKKEDELKAEKEEDGKLMRDEERAVNSISKNVYSTYILSGSGKLGYLFPILILFACAVSTFSDLFTNNWLSFWQDKKFRKPPGFYQGIYILLGFSTLLLLTFYFALIVQFCNKAANQFNTSAFQNLLHAPMSFIDTTPMGRVLNRFTKDSDVLDNEIQSQFRMFIQEFSVVVGTLILCIIYLPWFAIAIPVMIVAYYLIANFYLASSREIKRLEAVKRSEVYSHFNEALSGLDTIKAHSSSERFMETNSRLIDQMNESYFTFVAVQRWLACNLDIMVSFMCLFICLLCSFRIFHIRGAYAGLLLTCVFNIVGMLSYMLRAMTEIENQMNSVERLKFYAVDLEQEAPFDIPERNPSPLWPQRGAICFSNVTMSYREGLPPAVRNLSLDVAGGEKIGVCGRTGAGKSSVMYSLFRLAEFDGRITIDDVDISKIGLHKLRTSLSIIPQDPVLFSGNIRSNLDPFQEHSDDNLWDALSKAGLVETDALDLVKHQTKSDRNLHKFHLARLVEDDGSNFSLGERQLLALARALVRGSKILVLDEATSSVDYETDAKVQKTITNEFADCTVLCIAHRLKTIVKYDRIMVLDKGEIVELGKPIELYQHDGIFRSMCEKSGITRADFDI
ncbi:hypothetical protein OGAPHI_001366 [Ogataea philodendri]|uniref:Oligomycin resistance ATP-dependent permease YOR1 n=1 Tax=Ogataea philodendri TaxID=1378263 RepID=A0A9P8T8I7_9ASCO|nr:uncharacterized protein OGAPHI_001366 [Ogataea philodendri]KAH3669245.1 hypothetical protein OGAPHI_001366 [Ogataea philodendri]